MEITLEQLKSLLNEQKKIAAQSIWMDIFSSYADNAPRLTRAQVEQTAHTCRFPEEIKVLEKYKIK